MLHQYPVDDFRLLALLGKPDLHDEQELVCHQGIHVDRSRNHLLFGQWRLLANCVWRSTLRGIVIGNRATRQMRRWIAVVEIHDNTYPHPEHKHRCDDCTPGSDPRPAAHRRGNMGMGIDLIFSPGQGMILCQPTHHLVCKVVAQLARR